MKQVLYKNRFFLLPQLIFILISSLFLLLYTKPEIHIFLNSFNSPFFDGFFRLLTNLGDGIVYIPVLIFLLTRNYKWALVFVVAVVISNIIVMLSKNLLFSNIYRPSKYFELYESYKLHLVEGVRLHSMKSFPSGHTTTAFTVFFMLALITRNNVLKFALFVVALLTAYSRVYLSQHFLIDIVVGSVVGSGSVIASCIYFMGLKKRWMNKSIITPFMKGKVQTSTDNAF